MNNKDLAEHIIENKHDDADSKVIAKAFLKQLKLVEVWREKAEERDKEAWGIYDGFDAGEARGDIRTLRQCADELEEEK